MIAKFKQRIKKYYDLRARPRSFTVGQLVYYFNPGKYVRRSDKWERKYTGPFRVEKVLSPVNKSKPLVAHIDKVKDGYEEQDEKNNVAEEVPAHVEAEPPNEGSEELFDRPR